MWLSFEHSTPVLARLRAALARAAPQVHVYAAEYERIRYLAPLAQDSWPAAGRSWRVTSGQEFPERVDVLIITDHGTDLLAPIWNLRRTRPDAVCLLWLWDNHLKYQNNFRSAVAADGYFASHGFCMDYLLNPYSARLGHLPMGCAQWNAAEIGAALASARPRSDKFLAAYVEYEFSPRHRFLQGLANIPEAALLLMAPQDISRYFGQSKAQQLAEWCSYKTSVVVPVERDLSTRLFDALACGQIPLVSDAVVDLDRVIPPELQASLPILRFRDGDTGALLAAHAEAIRRFDAEGEAGIRRRHHFVASGHMLQHRLAAMLAVLVALDQGQAGIAYHPASGGLTLQARAGTAAGPPRSAGPPRA